MDFSISTKGECSSKNLSVSCPARETFFSLNNREIIVSSSFKVPKGRLDRGPMRHVHFLVFEFVGFIADFAPCDKENSMDDVQIYKASLPWILKSFRLKNLLI